MEMAGTSAAVVKTSATVVKTSAHKMDYRYRKIRGVWHTIRSPLTRVGRKWIQSQKDKEIYDKDRRRVRGVERFLPTAAEMKLFRWRLGLSQRGASKILGGGKRSFQNYEAQRALPGLAMANLMRLLGAYPTLLEELKEEAPCLTPMQIKALRVKLRLSQRGASKILGGGKRSFQKYEAGKEMPCIAMANLLRLIKEYPQLINKLCQPEGE